jgi:hypothetical protein
MARLKMIRSRLRYLARCACLAALMLVLSNDCGSPSNATTTNSADAVSDQASPGDAKTPAKSAAANTSQKAGSPAIGDARGIKLSGRVVYRGSPPARRVVNMAKDAKCSELHDGKPVLDEDLIISDGGVKNAFVRVQRGAPKIDYPVPEKPAVLNQKGCMFHPRVQGVRVGQRLLVGNGDPVTHNVRSFPVLNPAFNFGQPPNTDPRERVFEKAEREIEIQCDFHLWMHAYIFVMEHPFFNVSKDDGTYAIDGLPPGEYTLEAWHEKLGKQRKTVTVSDNDLVDVTFTFPR